jgi:hypothetical protein
MASHLDQTVTSTVLVPFEGVGGGVAELSGRFRKFFGG